MQDNCSIEDTLKAILQALQSVLNAAQIQIDYDVEAIATQASSRSLATTLQRVIKHAAERSPRGCIVEITGVETEYGIDIEVTNDAEGFEDDAKPAFLSRHGFCQEFEKFLSFAGTTLKVFSSRCPQGGTAWSIVQPRAMSARRAA